MTATTTETPVVAPASSPPRHRAGLVVAAVAAFGAALLTAWSALNNDVTYAFGGIEVAGMGGVSVWDVFVARPLVYRLFFGLLDGGRELLVGEASATVAHTVLRAETDLVVVGVATLLYFGFRRFHGTRPALVIAGATGLALIVSPPWHFLEPDWVAALAAVLAVGAALAPRPTWLGAVLGGFAAFLVIAVKLATFPIALLALLIVGLLSVRRSLWSVVTAGGFAAIWYAVTKQFLPWEWTWLADQANLVHDSPIHHGIRWDDIHKLLVAVGDVALLSPIVAVAPAAAALLVKRLPAGRPRRVGAAVAVVATGLSVASAYGQGEFFMYHFAIVPVLAAGVWGAALALCPAARLPLTVITFLFAAAGLILLRLSPEWRLEHVTPVSLIYAAAAAAAAVIACTWTGRLPWALGAVLLAVALIPASLPQAPYAFSLYDYQILNAQPTYGGYRSLSNRIGRDTPVIYLAFGSVGYNTGNPTPCRYPSPQWLQRAGIFPQVRTYPSYADNLKCLTDDHTARYLIWQTKWFSGPRASPQVRQLLAARFDCSPAARVPAPPDIVVCPAR